MHSVQIQKGAEAAATDINAAGGIHGEKILFTVRDDRLIPLKAWPWPASLLPTV